MFFAVKLKNGYYDTEKSKVSDNHTSLTGIEDTPILLAMNQHTLQTMRDSGKAKECDTDRKSLPRPSTVSGNG